MSHNQLVDTVPAAPRFEGLIDHTVSPYADFNIRNTVHDKFPGVVFTSTPGDVYSMYDNGALIGTIVATKDETNWIVPAELFTGSHTLAITATNPSGLVSAPMTVSIMVAAAPASPTYSGLIDHSVSHYSDADISKPVHDARPAIVVNGSTVGDTLNVYENGKLIGTGIVTEADTKIELPWLSNGVHHLNVIESNAAGFSLPLNLTLTVDAVAPATPTYLGLVDHSVSNYSDTDITKPVHDANPSIVITSTVGDTINVYEGNHLLVSVVATDAKTKIELPTLSNGVHHLNINESNYAGFSLPLTLTLTVDVPVAPATPSLLGMIDHTFNNNWNFNSGELSNDPNPTVVLTATIGDVLTVSDNGVVIGSIVATSEQMSWTMPTLANGRHSLTITESNGTGTSDPLTLKLTVYADGAIVPADTTPDAPQPPADTNVHVAVGLHDTFVAKGDHETADLNVDPAAYFKQVSAHIEGGDAGVHTLHLTGSNEVLDLTSLTGKTAAAKISGIEVIDLGGHTNSVSLSIADVLNLGQTDLFQYDGNKQMIVKGSSGDTVDLLHAKVARVVDTDWESHGTTNIGGVEYNVYQHEGAEAELLIQQGVHVVVH